MFKKLTSLLLDSIETITVSLSIFVLIYLFLGRPTEVLGYSMEPSLEPQQRLIVENITLRTGDLQRGDIVVLHSPTVPDTDYIKRLIGLPNDTVTIKDCKVYIDSQLLSEPYLSSDVCTRGGDKVSENSPLFIPEEQYLVMGDNREHSFDGRFFGLIPKSDISGRAFVRWWPPEQWKIF